MISSHSVILYVRGRHSRLSSTVYMGKRYVCTYSLHTYGILPTHGEFHVVEADQRDCYW